jgi:S-adenosyl-L-methionine hydrolase (adenosine-forming)
MDYNNNIPLITLTTDWGQHDYYIGMLKGKILSQISNLSIVDLTHDIPSFNIHNAAFIVKNSFEHFPKGSIHLVLVNSEACIIPRLLVIRYLEHFFVVPDNGIIGFLFNQIPEEVYGIDFQPEGGFASLNAYVKAIELLYKNQITNNGTLKVSDFDKKIALRATIDDSIITGSIIYIDSFKNAITNISKSLFERVGKGRNYNIYVQSNHNKISKLSTSYNQVESGELLGIFNSANLLEIAIRNGYAAELLSLRIGGTVRINFN